MRRQNYSRRDKINQPLVICGQRKSFSDLDMHALEKFARVMHEYGKKCIIGLIIVKDNPHEYIEKSNMSLDHFVEYMVSDLKSTSFSARIFYPKKTGEHIDVSVI